MEKSKKTYSKDDEHDRKLALRFIAFTIAFMLIVGIVAFAVLGG